MIQSLFRPRTQTPTPGRASLRILLIDNDEEEAILTRGLLRKVEDIEYTVDWSPTSAGGLAAILSGEHDAYLVDHNMGDRTGVDIIRAARAAGCHAPLVMLTGVRDRTTDLAALAAGATDFLVKGKTDHVLLDRTLRYAITQAQLIARLDRANRQIGGLEELGRLMLTEGATSSAIDRVAGVVADSLGIPCIAIYLERDGVLQLTGSRGYQYPRPTLDPADTQVERIRKAGQPVLVPTLTEAASRPAAGQAVAVEMSMPLIVQGKLAGLMTGALPNGPAIGIAEQAIMSVVADRLTAALELSLERGRADDRLARARRYAVMGLPTDGVIFDEETGLYTESFVGAFMRMLDTNRAMRDALPEMTLMLVGREDDAAADATGPGEVAGWATRLIDAFPGQLVTRHGASELAILVVGNDVAGAGATVRRVLAGIEAMGTVLAVGVATLRRDAECATAVWEVEASLAVARRVGAAANVRGGAGAGAGR